jgi:hypothetical protein
MPLPRVVATALVKLLEEADHAGAPELLAQRRQTAAADFLNGRCLPLPLLIRINRHYRTRSVKEPLMSSSPIDCDVPFDRHDGHLFIPCSNNLTGWANRMVPITVLHRGAGPTLRGRLAQRR